MVSGQISWDGEGYPNPAPAFFWAGLSACSLMLGAAESRVRLSCFSSQKMNRSGV